MKFANQVESIKKLQSNLVEVQGNIKNNCNKLEKELIKIVESRLKQAFPAIKFGSPKSISYDWLVGVGCGQMTSKWKPEVFFYSVAGYQLSGKGFWYEDSMDKFTKVKPPIPTKQFIVFLRELSEELGVTCRMCRREPYWATERAAGRYDSEFGGDDL